ncbi:MAG: hypothetical protein HYZ34_02950 [Ignavibacteriae bacterium]|nr:hypothetical protein [Ignavibacteriota bacterium]
MKNLLKQLREHALTIHIVPEDALEKITSLEMMITVFRDLRESFLHFVEVEYLRNEAYRKASERNPKILEDFKQGFELYIVDMKFGSLEASLAPNLVELDNPLFRDEILDWKKEKFTQYKHDVFFGNYQENAFVQSIMEKYTPEERNKIYKPIFKILSGKYKIDAFDATTHKRNVLVPPDELRRLQLVPPITQQPKKIEKNVIGYFKLLTDGTTIELKKSRIKEVYDVEVLEHDTYPFKPDTLHFGNQTYVLNNKLVCEVGYEDGMYFITSGDFEISVWGTTREGVEEAFAFTFSSLYQNYCCEDDVNLSPKAKVIKQKLSELIKSYYES